ncbi:hypothetical protein U9M48_021390, partial [Paspalum notatum var. saurae]
MEAHRTPVRRLSWSACSTTSPSSSCPTRRSPVSPGRDEDAASTVMSSSSLRGHQSAWASASVKRVRSDAASSAAATAQARIRRPWRGPRDRRLRCCSSCATPTWCHSAAAHRPERRRSIRMVLQIVEGPAGCCGWALKVHQVRSDVYIHRVDKEMEDALVTCEAFLLCHGSLLLACSFCHGSLLLACSFCPLD